MGESSCLVWSDAIDRNGQANRDQVQATSSYIVKSRPFAASFANSCATA
jgi:hypothetical protein